jgi:hypothetical protein
MVATRRWHLEQMVRILQALLMGDFLLASVVVVRRHWSRYEYWGRVEERGEEIYYQSGGIKIQRRRIIFVLTVGEAI